MSNHLPTNTLLGQLRVIEHLNWRDSYRLLIAENASGHRYVAFRVSETDQGCRWLYASASESRIDGLVSGQVALRQIYTQPEDGFVFRVDIPHAAPATVEVIPAEALDQTLLPPEKVFLEPQATFTAEPAVSAGHDALPVVHGIKIHRPRSSKALPFAAVATVAARWAKLVQSVLNSPPTVVAAQVDPCVFTLQTDAATGLPQFLQQLQTLITSPNSEQSQAIGAQDAAALTQLLDGLCADKLTLSIQLQSNLESPPVILSPASAKALRAAFLEISQSKIGPQDIPQADDLNKLFRMLELIQAGESNLSYHLGLSPRHINYHKQAARILDLLNDRDGLTSRGHYLVSLAHQVERYEIAMMLFESSPVGFAWLDHAGKQTAVDLAPDSAMAFLKAHSINLSDATMARRAQTLRYWVKAFQTQLPD